MTISHHVCLDGKPDAPALLLIHGTGASLRSWDPMMPLLTGAHHVIRVDLAGCGESPIPDDDGYALPDQARRIGTTLDQLGVEQVIVVGHSSGGAFATALTEQRPDLVTALVCVNTGPAMAAYIGGQEAAIDPARWADLTDDHLRQAVSSGFAPGFEIPREYLDQVRGMDLRVFAATSQAITAYLDEQALPDRLARLRKPLLVLFGEEDRRWRASSAAGYLAVPGATVTMLTGLGHSPNLEDPPRTAVPLLAFTAAVSDR